MSSTFPKLMPAASARSLARWITGPSAIGSENGTPSSMRSAPASTMACITGTVASGVGSPAVTNGMRAVRCCAFSAANRPAMRLACNKTVPPPSTALAGARFRAAESSSDRARGRRSQVNPLDCRDGLDVLVPASRQPYHDDVVGSHPRRQLHCIRQRMARFKGGNDPLGPRARMKRRERFVIVDRDVGRTPGILEPGMLRADPG